MSPIDWWCGLTSSSFRATPPCLRLPVSTAASEPGRGVAPISATASGLKSLSRLRTDIGRTLAKNLPAVLRPGRAADLDRLAPRAAPDYGAVIRSAILARLRLRLTRHVGAVIPPHPGLRGSKENPPPPFFRRPSQGPRPSCHVRAPSQSGKLFPPLA